VDSGNRSVISDPAAGKMTVLDHAKKTAVIHPAPSQQPTAPGMPHIPQFAAPALAGAGPQPPAMKVEDLGKKFLHGHEVEGKRCVMPAPNHPQFHAPGAPKRPHRPGVPPLPAASPPPTTTEVWHSPSMGVPMFTKVSGGFGDLTHVCKSAVPGEPHPSAFQIPHGYKVTGAAPKPPSSSRRS